MKSVLESALSEVLKPTETLNHGLFQRFNALYLHDGRTLNLPDACLPVQGVGGDAKCSALKLDVSLELITGMVHIKLLNGRDSNNRSPHATACYQQNTLRFRLFQPVTLTTWNDDLPRKPSHRPCILPKQ